MSRKIIIELEVEGDADFALASIQRKTDGRIAVKRGIVDEIHWYFRPTVEIVAATARLEPIVYRVYLLYRDAPEAEWRRIGDRWESNISFELAREAAVAGAKRLYIHNSTRGYGIRREGSEEVEVLP